MRRRNENERDQISEYFLIGLFYRIDYLYDKCAQLNSLLLYICHIGVYISLIKANIQSFDFWHANRTICAINGSNNENPKDLTCFSVDNFSISWTFPKPEIITNRNCKYIISLKLINRE